jgi:hypothetical protein
MFPKESSTVQDFGYVCSRRMLFWLERNGFESGMMQTWPNAKPQLKIDGQSSSCPSPNTNNGG